MSFKRTVPERTRQLWIDLGLTSSSEDDEPQQPSAPPSKVPRVGTAIQRSDHQQARKRAWLTETPPPLTRRARKPPPNNRDSISSLTQPKEGPTHRPSQQGKQPAKSKEEADPGHAKDQGQPPCALPPLRPTRSVNPPPVTVEYKPGYTTSIPYYAIYTSRRYRLRTEEGIWNLRFTREGSLRYCKLSPR